MQPAQLVGEPNNPWDEASFDWPLAPDAVVVEVGGFAGRWLVGMAARYSGQYHAYDPQSWAITRLVDRWNLTAVSSGSSLYPHRVGLGLREEVREMRGWGTDACSFLMDDAYFAEHPEEGRRDPGQGQLVDAAKALNVADFPRIDVMMMNIEGFEFVLLPYLLSSGIIDRVEHLAVQFHEAHDPEGTLQSNIRTALARTHDVRFEYPALTAWSRR